MIFVLILSITPWHRPIFRPIQNCGPICEAKLKGAKSCIIEDHNRKRLAWCSVFGEIELDRCWYHGYHISKQYCPW